MRNPEEPFNIERRIGREGDRGSSSLLATNSFDERIGNYDSHTSTKCILPGAFTVSHFGSSVLLPDLYFRGSFRWTQVYP